MNIFYLSHDPQEAARFHCDRHVVKMILESAQLLSTAVFLQYNETLGYHPTHQKHPCVKWLLKEPGNYRWLVSLAQALSNEYTYRYNKLHKSAIIVDRAVDYLIPIDDVFWATTNPVQCMPSVYKIKENPILAYRNYYLGAKKHLLSYTRREIPSWIQEKGLGIQK